MSCEYQVIEGVKSPKCVYEFAQTQIRQFTDDMGLINYEIQKGINDVETPSEQQTLEETRQMLLQYHRDMIKSYSTFSPCTSCKHRKVTT